MRKIETQLLVNPSREEEFIYSFSRPRMKKKVVGIGTQKDIV